MIGNKTIVGLVITTMVLSCVAVAVTADEGRVEPMGIYPDSITHTEIATDTVRNIELTNEDTFHLDGGIVVDSTHFTVSGSTGAITVQPGYGLDANSSGNLKLGDGTATGILIGTTAATDIDIGAGENFARSIDIGNGTGIDTIKIGTGGTGEDDIDIGDALADVAITGASQIVAGTDDALTISTSGSGNLVIDADDALDIDADTAITIDTATTMTLTSAGMTLVAGSGALDIDAGAAITIDTDSTVAGITIQSTGANEDADVTLQTIGAGADVIIATGDDFTLSATSANAAVSIADGANVHAITIGTDNTPANTIGIGGDLSTTTFRGTVVMPSGAAVAHLLNYTDANVSVEGTTYAEATEVLNTSTGSDNITTQGEKNFLITYSANTLVSAGELIITNISVISSTGAHLETSTQTNLTFADCYATYLQNTIQVFVEDVAVGTHMDIVVRAKKTGAHAYVQNQTLTVIAV